MNRIWIATAIGVVLIIGVAFLLRGERGSLTPLPPDMKQESIMASYPAPEPSPSAPTPAISSSFSPFTGGKDMGADKWGRPLLQMDKLAGTLKVSLPVLTEKEQRLPLAFTCFRANVSPPMAWEGVPVGAKSLVVFLERREQGVAPFISWALFDIPATGGDLKQNLPKQAEAGGSMRHARSDHDAAEYVGPCEPKGKIPYAIRLFALDTVLDLEPGLPVNNLIRAMNGHVLDATEVSFIHYLAY
jgi:Raf kinase inhibitor-like YbhB/YbcL family protein